MLSKVVFDPVVFDAGAGAGVGSGVGVGSGAGVGTPGRSGVGSGPGAGVGLGAGVGVGSGAGVGTPGRSGVVAFASCIRARLAEAPPQTRAARTSERRRVLAILMSVVSCFGLVAGARVGVLWQFSVSVVRCYTVPCRLLVLALRSCLWVAATGWSRLCAHPSAGCRRYTRELMGAETVSKS